MPTTARRVATALAVVAFGAAVLAGCTSEPATHVRLTVTPATALFDAPVTVRVTGLRPRSDVTLTASTRDRHGTDWRDSATFTADGSGDASNAEAPKSGSYRGANPMGLLQNEAPNGDVHTESFQYPPDPWTVTITASVDGQRRASVTIHRHYPHQVGVTSHELRPATADGIYGEYEQPVSTVHKRPALLVIGGSEGGLSDTLKSQLLAAHGYPTLALAYFHAPGLPQQLAGIRLEYFATALTWLARQPGVDPRRLVIWGVSRGSEAALLVGAHFPSLVDGVVATSPSDIAYGAISRAGGPAWTWRGRPVPYASGADFHSTVPLNRAALIPVTAIRGPVFAACGLDDELWPSCGHVASLQRRLALARYRPTVQEYPGAGHFVGSLLPDVPSTEINGTDAAGDHYGVGGYPAATEAGQADGFARLLRWLATLPAPAS